VQALKNSKADSLSVQLVLVNAVGEAVPQDSLNFEQLTLDAV